VSATKSTEPTAAWIKAMRTFLRRFLIAFAIALPVGVLIGWLIGGSEGAWGVVLGLAVVLCFFGVSLAVALVGARLSPQAMGALVLGSYLVKITLAIIVLNAVSDLTFYSKPALGITVLIGTIAYLAGETYTLMKARIPYVEPTKAD
jgi:hypothetical protein